MLKASFIRVEGILNEAQLRGYNLYQERSMKDALVTIACIAGGIVGVMLRVAWYQSHNSSIVPFSEVTIQTLFGDDDRANSERR
jgi:hypothetical protein